MATMTRGELIDLVGGFAAQDPDYKKLLKDDPKDVIAKQLQIEVPADLNVKVVEEDANTMYIVVPFAPAEGAELSDSDLEAVAGGGLFGGGGSSTSYNCGTMSGGGSGGSKTQRGNFTRVSIASGSRSDAR
jgi:hypothetical protein